MIPYTLPSITQKEIDFVHVATVLGWGENCNNSIRDLEADFSKYIGTKYAHATSSCTGALHLGLAALGIGKGDEVILADTNWIATCAPIVYLGATPVFVDISDRTWCINPDAVNRAITKKTKAIIATHLYGNLCWMNTLRDIGMRKNIPIIEDAAEAIGSKYHGERAGSMGRFGVFSFHGTKTMTTGEGGMFVTDDEKLYKKVCILNNHGRDPKEKKQFFPTVLGYKYKMSNIQAAIGLAQLERIEWLVSRKREIFANYRELLKDYSGRFRIEMNPQPTYHFNSYWMPTVVSRKRGARNKYIKAFKEADIDARVFFYPLSSLPMFEKVHNPVAYDICTRAINLPSFPSMTLADQEAVVKVIKEVEK